MSPTDRLDRVVSDLERDQNVSRVKKLLYCTCYGVWEDDAARLAQVALKDIVQGVWERSPTLDALQFQLNRIVKTLNKPVEYAHVANAILRSMTQLYRDAYDITRPLNRSTQHSTQRSTQLRFPQSPGAAGSSPSAGAASGQRAGATGAATQWLGAIAASPVTPLSVAELEAQVSEELASHGENLRLKKLLVCVCKNVWENDPVRLAAVNWELLIQETQELIPTLENLDYVLQAIVKSLSKPLDYLPLASRLIQTMRPLYENRPKSTDTLFYGIEGSPARPQPTEFFGAPVNEALGSVPHPEPGLRMETKPQPESATPFSPESSKTQVIQPNGAPATTPFWHPAAQSVLADVATGLLAPLPDEAPAGDLGEYPRVEPGSAERFPPDLMGSGEEGVAESDSAGPLVAPEPELSDQEKDFALRLEIMRYANPLMVKIVLFSAIHRLFRFSDQDWTELRHHTLMGLFKTLRQNYPNFTDIEAKLCLTAESIELRDNALQTVAAILKVLRPDYPQGEANGPERQFRLPQAAATSLEDDLAALAAALEEEESPDQNNSCQVF